MMAGPARAIYRIVLHHPATDPAAADELWVATEHVTRATRQDRFTLSVPAGHGGPGGHGNQQKGRSQDDPRVGALVPLPRQVCGQGDQFADTVLERGTSR